MTKRKEDSAESVLEEVSFILNEIRNEKLRMLEKTRLNSEQEKVLEEIQKDLKVVVTKLGLLLHSVEL